MNKLILVFIFTLALCTAALAQSNFTDDTFVITTYYPAPYGVYRNMRLQPSDLPTNGVAPGVMYFNQTNDQLYIYQNDTTKWQPLGGGGGGYWAADPTTGALYNTNPVGNVEIGTHSDSAKLEVYSNSTQGVVTISGNPSPSWLTDHPGAPYSTLQLQDATNNTWFIIHHRKNPVTNDLAFTYWNDTLGSTQMLIEHDTGNVGIGTITPTQKLDVNGNITATDVCTAGGKCLSTSGGSGISYTYYCFSSTTYGNPVCTNAGGTQGYCPSGYTQKRALGSWGYCYYFFSGNNPSYFLPPGGSCGTSSLGGTVVGSAYICSQ